jgi:hypothetical protein
MMWLFKRLFGKSGPGPAAGPPPAGCPDPVCPFPPLSVAPLSYNRFDLADVAAWRAALDAYGFVVLAGVLSPAEVFAATSLLWDYLEERTHGDRYEPSSWGHWPEESFRYGMVQGDGVHCDGAWFVRGLPGVRAAFANLFGTDRLHVSFDGFPALRPFPAVGPSARDWYHIDHALDRHGRWLAQGLVALTPSSSEDGGLVVWPCSHRLHADRWGERPVSGGAPAGTLGDFVMLKHHPQTAAAMPRDAAGLGPVKLCTAAGDLALWDSRTVHCNAPLGPIPNVAPAVPSLTDLAAACPACPGGDPATGSWSTLPRLAEPADAAGCACAACRGAVSTRPSAPLGRLGVYVCMQPAALTDAPPWLREALVRHQALTGHVPFRNVQGIGRAAKEELKPPLPRLVAGCRVRRELAGLDRGADETSLLQCGRPTACGPD